MTEDIQITGIPENAKSLFNSLLISLSHNQDSESLSNKLADYMERIHEKAETNKQINVDMADTIAKKIRNMLVNFDRLEPAKQRVIRAGVMYFIIESDGDLDTNSLAGFDDDASVIQAIEQTLFPRY